MKYLSPVLVAFCSYFLLDGCQAFVQSIPGKNVLLTSPLSISYHESSRRYHHNPTPINHGQNSFPRNPTQSASTAISMPTPSHRNPLRNLRTKLANLSERSKWRIAACTFLTCLALFHSRIDTVLVSVWNYLQNSPALLPTCFRHDHWEWVLAVSAFFVWFHSYWFCDLLCTRSAKRGVRHPLRNYRLQDHFEAEKFFSRRRRRQKHLQLEGEHKGEQQEKPPLSKIVPWHTQAWLVEVPLYCVPLFIWDRLAPRRAAAIAKVAAPTTFKICTDVTAGLLLYDFGFFLCHLLMHRFSFLFKAMHAKHHHHREVRASDTIRLAFGEEVVDVVISILALRFLRAHPLSRTIYNTIITFLLVELHSGYVFPWSPQEVMPGGIATGSRRHHYHHRYGKHYYQKFFFTFDRLFGFVDKRVEEQRNKPLTSVEAV